MIRELQQLSTRVSNANPFWEYRIDEYVQPNGKPGEYYYVHTPGSVMIIAQMPDKTFVMNRQYRYLNRRISLEFPGGGLPAGIDPKIQANKELEEETGWSAGKLDVIGHFCPFNGITDEICTVFYATELFQPSEAAKPDDSEEFEHLFLSLQHIHSAIRSGELFDGMSLAAWQLFSLSVLQNSTMF